jgi:mono/diheme cytochrome c family protein
MKITKTFKLSYIFLYSICFIAISVFMIGCSKEQKTEVTEKKKDSVKTNKTAETKAPESAGKKFFYMKSESNNIACADCHSDGTNSANPETKYFSNIQGADKRTSTYHGKFTGEQVAANAGGATVCWEAYMRIKTPMTAEQIKILNEYYESVAAKDSPAEMKYETIALPTRDKSKLKAEQKNVMGLTGDPVKGETEFKNACGICHGENSTIKKVPDLFEDFDGNVKSITYNVRLGDGGMPFYKNSVLSDQELADISAYILKKNGQ